MFGLLHRKVTTIDLIREIMKDVLITHGHPVAWVGAIFHALFCEKQFLMGIALALIGGNLLLKNLKLIVQCCLEDSLLKDIWVPNWERLSGKSLSIGVSQTINDMKNDIMKISKITGSNFSKNINTGTPQQYKDVVLAIDAFNPRFRISHKNSIIINVHCILFLTKSLRLV